ncbi:hypothetical protein Btru_029916, partial [Bulinus truncatus]
MELKICVVTVSRYLSGPRQGEVEMACIVSLGGPPTRTLSPQVVSDATALHMAAHPTLFLPTSVDVVSMLLFVTAYLPVGASGTCSAPLLRKDGRGLNRPMVIRASTFIVYELNLSKGENKAIAAEDGNNVSCLADWTKIHRGCYKFGTDVELGWTEAREKCKEYGAELVVILSESERDELQQYLVDNYPDGSTWWAGLNREETSGSNWRWLDGSTVITKTT